MPRFLIEVPHNPDPVACARVIHVFLSTGSHFLTNAEWGCTDNVHKAWMLVDVENRQEALAIVPPMFRRETTVVAVKHFSMAEIEPTIRKHGALAAAAQAAEEKKSG